jgi:hypothetical protein
MMGVSGDLYRAVNGLRKAAEAELTGNTYYQTVNRIEAFTEIIGPVEETAIPGEDTAYGIATTLIEVRKEVQSHLSDNRYYMAVNRLEELASFVTLHAEAPVRRGLSFDELAAASKARAEAAAASLGIMTARRAAPLPAQSAETLANGELEKRSSESCLMAELAPPAMEPVASAPVFTKTATSTPLHEGAESLGSQAAQGEHSAAQGTAPPAAAADPATAGAFPPSTPAHDSEAAPARQTVEEALDPAGKQEIRVTMPDENKRKEPKTLFKLWLDLAFGRKD